MDTSFVLVVAVFVGGALAVRGFGDAVPIQAFQRKWRAFGQRHGLRFDPGTASLTGEMASPRMYGIIDEVPISFELVLGDRQRGVVLGTVLTARAKTPPATRFEIVRASDLARVTRGRGKRVDVDDAAFAREYVAFADDEGRGGAMLTDDVRAALLEAAPGAVEREGEDLRIEWPDGDLPVERLERALELALLLVRLRATVGAYR